MALIEELGLHAHVTLLGPLPTADVIKWMHASHVFMLPSLAEGTPTVLLEAQASGMPVLATDVGGVRDIVQDGLAGSIVPAADVAALVEKLQQFIDHPEAWPRMGPRGAGLWRRNTALSSSMPASLRSSSASSGAWRRTPARMPTHRIDFIDPGVGRSESAMLRGLRTMPAAIQER